jgi:hypothetical protein
MEWVGDVKRFLTLGVKPFHAEPCQLHDEIANVMAPPGLGAKII